MESLAEKAGEREDKLWKEAQVLMNSKYQLSRSTINTIDRRARGRERGIRWREEISFSLFSEQKGGYTRIHLKGSHGSP